MGFEHKGSMDIGGILEGDVMGSNTSRYFSTSFLYWSSSAVLRQFPYLIKSILRLTSRVVERHSGVSAISSFRYLVKDNSPRNCPSLILSIRSVWLHTITTGFSEATIPSGIVYAKLL